MKERVLEAEAAAMTARLNTSVLAMLDKTLADLKARRADAADEGSRKLIAEQIANFEAEAERVRRESREKEPDSIRANMKTLEPFRARLAAAHEALDRPLLPVGRQGTFPDSGRQAVSAGRKASARSSTRGSSAGSSRVRRPSSSRRRRRSPSATRATRASSPRANAGRRGPTRSGTSRR